MRKKIFILLILSLFVSNLLPDNQVSDFNIRLKKMNMSFKMPVSFNEMPEVEQYEVTYYIGYKRKNRDVEYRISLFYDDDVQKVKKAFKNINSKTAIEMMTSTVMMNLSQDENIKSKYIYYKEADAKKEFGADFGFTQIIRGNSDFTKGYQYVSVNVIYKEKQGLAFIFILFNDINEFMNQSNFTEPFCQHKFSNI